MLTGPPTLDEDERDRGTRSHDAVPLSRAWVWGILAGAAAVGIINVVTIALVG